ncbi:hypothetical protein BC827DRAFT_1131281 [Russula dissimulans]|nr:hypothetical protein BC827DRAFT_1131281 [Russula dissimulans]
MASWPADSSAAYASFQYREKNVYQRLKKTIKAAEDEQKKSAKKAFETGWAQNIALGLQVLLGALTTALGAALGGKKTSVAISILGGATTLVASYLARTKGSNEPELSLRRSRDLDQFLREINAFVLDHGHEYGKTWDDKIEGFRFGLERLLGNNPESITVSQDRDGPGGTGPGGPNTNFYGQEKRFGVDPTNAGYNGNG